MTETNYLLWKTDVDGGTISISSTSTSTLVSWSISFIFAGNRLGSLALCERVRPAAEIKQQLWRARYCGWEGSFSAKREANEGVITEGRLAVQPPNKCQVV